MAEIGKDINKAKELLEQGELVSIPTETVYGLAANALNAAAVAKIFSVKKRPAFDPLIVHIADASRIHSYAVSPPPKALLLAEKFWPGPLTIVFERNSAIPDLVTSGLATVGLRCPDHALTRSLLSSIDFPLAAPSANPFGYVSPTRPEHVNDQLGNEIPYILDGGPCNIGIESTIVGFEQGNPIVYRIGGLAVEVIESVIGPVRTQLSASNPKAPGQLISHYSPSKRVILGKLEDLLQKYPAHCSGILSFTCDFNSPFQKILSTTGSLEEAAQNLFSHLRAFEEFPVDVILAEEVPDVGIGRAINDRLKRASAK